MRKLYPVLWILDMLAALACLIYLLAGVADGTAPSGDIGFRLAMTAVMAAFLAGGYRLNRRGRRGLAAVVLLIPAVPALLYLLFLALLLFSRTPWN